jgi:integrase
MTMAKRRFTDRFIRTLRPAPPGKRVEHWDAVVPCFGVRVTDKTHKTFVLYTRWPGSRSPTRREIGNADRLPLADARQVAREWLRLVELGIDPHEQRRAAEAEARQKKQTTFESVAEAWFRETVCRMAKRDEIERAMTLEFVDRWRGRPITSITTLEVRDIIKNKALGLAPAPNAKKKGPAEEQARNLLLYIKQLFTWAVEQHAYGIERSPADPLKGDRLIGPKNQRERELSNDELRKVWFAAGQMPYPYGPLLQMLIMTGQRRSEVADARWSEFDLGKREWTIPAARMKMRKVHVVPITEDLLAFLRGLPRFTRGDHLFSTTFGERSVGGFSKARERLDKITGPIPHWVIHDLRRTMRSHLADEQLGISERVAESMIAHAPPGIIENYVRYKYLEEKRRGFAAWHERLREILAASPPTSNVVPLRG